MPTQFRYCLDCYEQYNLSRFEGIDWYAIFEKAFNYPGEEDSVLMKELEATTEDYRKVYDQIERRGYCVECFDVLRLDYARRYKLPLPFTPYENTLAYPPHQEVAQRLLKKVKEHCSPLIEHSWRIGSITSPMSISFYCVTDKQEQDALIDFVNECYAGIGQSQRRVAFYETTLWQKTATTTTRLDPKLLREVYFD